MRKYYIDTEFIEGMRRPISWLPSIFGFNKKQWHIELISIGIKCEDGRTYEAISNEFNPRHASKWVRENVIAKLPLRYKYESVPIDTTMGRNYDGPMSAIVTEEHPLYKSNAEIAEDIRMFVNPHEIESCSAMSKSPYYKWEHSIEEEQYIKVEEDGAMSEAVRATSRPEFIAYFADYDWVVFCSLYGSMMGLPKGFPKYCTDLKQELDRIVWDITDEELAADIGDGSRNAFDNILKAIKAMPEYPTQDNEHSALDDALWNEKLDNFITQLKIARRNAGA